MYRSKNQFFKQTVYSIWLIASLQIQADSSLNLSINKHQDTFETAAMKIWDWAEVGYQEYKSSELLKNELQSNGFSIQSGVAEIPTAFIAEYSNGGPVIGILGEYDALPGLMQTSSPFKEIKGIYIISIYKTIIKKRNFICIDFVNPNPMIMSSCKENFSIKIGYAFSSFK